MSFADGSSIQLSVHVYLADKMVLANAFVGDISIRTQI